MNKFTHWSLVVVVAATACVCSRAASAQEFSDEALDRLRVRLRNQEPNIAPYLIDRVVEQVGRMPPPQSTPPYLYGTPYAQYRALSPYVGLAAIAAAVNNGEKPPLEALPQAPEGETKAAAANRAKEAYKAGKGAFRAKKYREAIQHLANGSVADQSDARTQELLSLAMFALNDYRGAAATAHAAAFFGSVSDWPTVYTYYGDRGPYTEQLRALEKHVRDQPLSPDAVFLLGYHYMTLGQQEAALATLKKALELAPNDALAIRLVAQLEAAGQPRPRNVPPPPRPNPPK